MAYSERYYHIFCDKFNNNFRASILEQDYVGAAALIEGGPRPVVIRYESFSDFKFDTIRASQCIITLVSSDTFNSQNFYTGDEKKFKIEIYKNSVLFWTGYLMPNGLREDFTGVPYYIILTASDYLPGIKNIKFLQDDGSQYVGRQTFIEVLQNCAAKTELGLGLDTYVNVYPTAVTPGANVDPLNETDINPGTFIENRNRELPEVTTAGRTNPRPRTKYPSQSAKSDKPRPFNCYEVIDYNASLWNSRFFQEDARWKFERINYKYLLGTVRHYDPSGTMEGTSQHAAPRVVDCSPSPQIKLVGGTQSLSMDRVFKRVTVEYKFSYDDTQNNITQYLRNGDFEDFTTHNPGHIWNYWGWTPGAQPKLVSQGTNDGIWIDYFSDKNKLVQSWPIIASEGDEFFFEFTVRLRPGSTGSNVQFAIFQIYIDGNFNFSTGGRPRPPYSTDTAAYLSGVEKTAKWYGEPLWIGIPIDPQTQDGQMVTVRYNAEPLPGNGKMYVRFYGTGDQLFGQGTQGHFETGPGGETITPTFGVTEVYDIKVGKIAKSVTDEAGEASFVSEQDGNFTDEPSIVTIINADDATPDHISGINIHDSQIPTSLWTVEGQPEYQPDLIGIVVARSILEQYKQPYHIIEGSIKGPDLKFSDVFQFEMPGVQNELFMVQRGDFDLIQSELSNATLVQISDTVVDSDGTIDGNETEPKWNRTGNVRCIRDGNGENTGDAEAEERDYNPYSPTYGQTRWINIGPSGACVVGDYYEFLWAASDPALNQPDLENWPFAEGTDQVTVWFTNPNGKYLWFLHRPAAGTVVSVLDSENEECISDWTYQADETVDGHLFKAIRMNYYTGIYDDIPMTFVFG